MTTETQAAPATDITTLPPAERALIVLSSTKTEEALKSMVEEAKAITEVKDKAGRDQAHRVAMKLQKARTTIEKTGKTAREDAQAFSRAVIAEEKRLKDITAAEEDRIFKLRDAFDEAERAAKEAQDRAEAARKADILSKIDGIRMLPASLAGESSGLIQDEIDALAAFQPDEVVFGEFTEAALVALADALAAMRDLHAKVKGQEAAAELLEAERQRLAEVERQANERAAAAEAEAANLRAQLAALQAQQAPVVVDSGSVSAPAGDDEAVTLNLPADVAAAVEANPAGAVQALEQGAQELTFGYATTTVSREEAEQLFPATQGDEFTLHDKTETAIEPSAQPTDFRIRSAALATADQFTAIADKVQACGFEPFANELRAVAYSLREGDHDANIAAANPADLIEADNRLLDATVQCIEVFAPVQEAA
jgi:hypothetical protein